MIEKIYVNGLKSIDKLELKCKNLNIITGTNSSGKSTFLQALLLFFQTHSKFKALKSLSLINGLNGSLISLGEFRENKNIYISNKEIKISIKFANWNSKFPEICFQEDDDLNCICDYNCSSFYEGLENDLNEITDDLKYLSCNRIGAQDVFKKNYYEESIGLNGEYAIDFLNKHKLDNLDSKLIKDNESETLYAQVNYWSNYILNTRITTEDIKGTDILKASYKVNSDKVNSDREIRPKNVGSGISYLISILVLCLSSKNEDILIIENPEIHLHPNAQSRVCEFLYFISKSRRQIFIETHSDHIFNGIRAGIATNEVSAENVAVNFFELDDNNCTKNNVIKFGRNGQIDNAPAGLFDQFSFDLDRMLGLN